MSLVEVQGLLAEVPKVMSAKFLDEKECIRWWIDRCYPGGPECPRCKAAITNERALQSFHELSRLICGNCGQQFRATKGTLLEGAQLTPSELFLFCMMIGLKASNDQIAATLQLHIGTVIGWRDRIAIFDEVHR